MTEKILIDTTILINAYFLINKKNKKKAIEIIEKYANTPDCYISIQNIIEFINISKKKFNINKNDLKDTISEIKTLFNVINYTENSIEPALNLSFLKKISFLDALLIQTMLDNQINIIYTSNETIFNNIKEIRAINPFKK